MTLSEIVTRAWSTVEASVPRLIGAVILLIDGLLLAAMVETRSKGGGAPQ